MHACMVKVSILLFFEQIKLNPVKIEVKFSSYLAVRYSIIATLTLVIARSKNKPGHGEVDATVVPIVEICCRWIFFVWSRRLIAWILKEQLSFSRRHSGKFQCIFQLSSRYKSSSVTMQYANGMQQKYQGEDTLPNPAVFSLLHLSLFYQIPPKLCWNIICWKSILISFVFVPYSSKVFLRKSFSPTYFALWTHIYQFVSWIYLLAM